MAPITQILLLSLRVSVVAEEVVNEAVTMLREQKSIRRFRWSMMLQEDNKLCIFVDWDEKSALDRYLQSDAYQRLLRVMNSHTNEPITVHKVEFVLYDTAVLDNKGGQGISPVAEALYMYFGGAQSESGNFQDAATTTIQQFLQAINLTATGMTGESSIGWTLDEVAFKGEMCRTCVLVVGWQSVESQLQFLASESFNSAFPIIGGMQGFRGVTIGYGVFPFALFIIGAQARNNYEIRIMLDVMSQTAGNASGAGIPSDEGAASPQNLRPLGMKVVEEVVRGFWTLRSCFDINNLH